MTQTAQEKQDSQVIAKTIRQQLGGRRFTVMTGAKNYCAHEAGLSMRIPGRTKSKINYLKILLLDDDTYSMEFGRIWGNKYTVVKMIEGGVYCDQLQRIFTETTGLDTYL